MCMAVGGPGAPFGATEDPRPLRRRDLRRTGTVAAASAQRCTATSSRESFTRVALPARGLSRSVLQRESRARAKESLRATRQRVPCARAIERRDQGNFR